MPPITTPKISRSNNKKVALISKPKGAVRAKSGCYTCRIRRKKCDEKRMHEDGPCETCFRLKLECLGFGAKRPEWLRENSRVSSIRDRIKAHLAAQGMIKGHAGSGSRNAVQEDILKLSDYGAGEIPSYRTGGSSSSSDGEDSMDSDRPSYNQRLTLHTSSMRGMYEPRYDDYPVHSDIHSRCDSPLAGSSLHDYDDGDYPLTIYQGSELESPAIRSAFSVHYNLPANLYVIDEIPEEAYGPDSISHFHPSELVSYHIITESIRNYVTNVVKIQYLLGDRNVLPDMIWNAISSHPDSHEAVNLLSKAYYGRQTDAGFSVLTDYSTVSTIQQLKFSLAGKGRFTADDAMTALHIISLYLFDGGRGKWNEFLLFASQYVRDVLENPIYRRNYPAALEAASAKDQFVVKTTIWFDVLASITTQEPPILLDCIRELFKPNKSWVGQPYTYSMLNPMGCENDVVWALAETSYLSYWKRRHEATGDLSVRELVRQVSEIESYLQPGPRPHRPQMDNDAWSRFIASEIFRTSAKLFLKSVESGDYPHVREIQLCVKDTCDAIMQMDTPINLSETRSAIVRSTVFGIFICGSLTDNDQQRRMLKMHLVQNSGYEGVGNCTVVSNILDEVWETRRLQNPNMQVAWRQHLKRHEILLV